MRQRDQDRLKIMLREVEVQEITCEIAELREQIAALETEREYACLGIVNLRFGRRPHRSGKRC